jgi:high frequency lysogenization protein
LALAGLYQSVDLVCQIAWRGQPQATPLKASLGSLFMLEADSYEDVYGGVEACKQDCGCCARS